MFKKLLIGVLIGILLLFGIRFLKDIKEKTAPVQKFMKDCKGFEQISNDKIIFHYYIYI